VSHGASGCAYGPDPVTPITRSALTASPRSAFAGRVPAKPVGAPLEGDETVSF